MMFNIYIVQKRLKNEFKLWNGYFLEHWLKIVCLFLVFLGINGSVQNTREENSQGKTFGVTITQVWTTTNDDEQESINKPKPPLHY